MVVDVRNLQYNYPNSSKEAINGLNFSINKGEIFGFLGPSGAGKSTTQKILIGLLKNYKGQVTVFDKSLEHWKNDYYEKIGVGFELPNHFEKLSALENLRFFASLYNKKIDNLDCLLDKVNLKDDGKLEVSKFSKGMKMRLNFARAIMHNPDLIFLDEPTSGLDPLNARRIKDLILEQKNNGKTVFLTTHNMHDAEELCDRIAFIVKGEIKVVDTPGNLKIKSSKNILTVEYLNGDRVLKKDFNMNTLGTDKEFMDLIKNYRIKTMHSKESDLEDIFIKITGESIK
jgi:fluoroquinolone transport system ATP-binding protein